MQRLRLLFDWLLIPLICLIIAGRLIGFTEISSLIAVGGTLYLARYILFHTPESDQLSPNLVDLAVVIVVLTEAIVCWGATYKANPLNYLLQSIFLLTFYWLVRTNLRRNYQLVAVASILSIAAFYFAGRTIYLFWQQYQTTSALGLAQRSDFNYLLLLPEFPRAPYAEWITTLLALLPFPIILIAKLTKATRIWWVSILPILAILVAILLTFSRGLYIATLTFGVVTGALFYLYRVAKLSSILSLNAFLLFVVLIGVSLTPFASSVVRTISLFGTQSQTRSFQGRVTVWEATTTMFKDHPAVGVGSDNFAMYYVAYKDEDAAYVGRPLSSFLQIMVEKGILGCLAYGFLVLSFYRASFYGARQAVNSPVRLVTILIFAAAVTALLVRDFSYSSILVNKEVRFLLCFMFAYNAQLEEKGNEIRASQ